MCLQPTMKRTTKQNAQAPGEHPTSNMHTWVQPLAGSVATSTNNPGNHYPRSLAFSGKGSLAVGLAKLRDADAKKAGDSLLS